MRFLRSLFDKAEHHFEKGGAFEKFYPLYEAVDTGLFKPGSVTRGSSHVRDGLDLKFRLSEGGMGAHDPYADVFAAGGH